jgi:hypothetical protein
VHPNSLAFADGGEFFDWLKNTDFIVYEHDGDDSRIGADRFFKVGRSNDTVPANRKKSGIEALPLKRTRTFENAFVLNLGDNDVLFVLVLEEMKRAFQREIIRFGRAGRENEIVGMAVDESRNGLTGFFNGGHGFFAKTVLFRMGVPVGKDFIGKHGIENAWIKNGGRLGVEVMAVEGTEEVSGKDGSEEK